MNRTMFYRFHYDLKDPKGEIVDTSRSGEPISFVEGDTGVVPGLHAAISGRDQGEQFSVTIPPEQAYGWPQRSLIRIVSKSMFDPGLDITPGRLFQVGSGTESEVVKVIDVQEDGVTVDGNHPLAGITLNFDIEIVEAREASSDDMRVV